MPRAYLICLRQPVCDKHVSISSSVRPRLIVERSTVRLPARKVDLVVLAPAFRVGVVCAQLLNFTPRKEPARVHPPPKSSFPRRIPRSLLLSCPSLDPVFFSHPLQKNTPTS